MKSTPRKLLAALQGSLPAKSLDNSAYVGKVEYASDDELHGRFANAIDRYGVNAFKEPKLRAHSLLMKRPAFAHESEVRLMYVDQRPVDTPQNRIQVRLSDVNQVIDEVRFDPRLQGLDLADRAHMAKRDYGRPPYTGPIAEWPAYQRALLQIIIDSINDFGDWTPDSGRRKT